MKNIVTPKNNIQSILKLTHEGMHFLVNLNQTMQKPLQLKTILKNKLQGATFIEKLKIKIILADNIFIDFIDDLLDFDIAQSSIEFILNKNSNINYNLNISELQEINQTDDGLLIAYNKQGYFEKELIFKFIGTHSQANAKCIIKGTNNRLFKIKTIQDHQAGNTKSDLLVKGAFCQKSKLFCDSVIKVNKNAQMVQACQLNKNLLLGCHSEAISIPKLEVEADNVDCKHGSATSHLDEEQIFYLQSRGINHCNAKNLLINAFLN